MSYLKNSKNVNKEHLSIEDWLDQINRITLAFKKNFEALSEEEQNWKPNDQTWSIAQNIDHLIIINESYFPILKALRNGTHKTPLIGRLQFITKLMGKAMLKAVQPDQKKKTKTFAIWEPTKGEIITAILKKFETHQEDLKRQIKQSEEQLKKRVILTSPANKYIVYSLYTAFEIIITHEKRHFEQARGVLEVLKNT